MIVAAGSALTVGLVGCKGKGTTTPEPEVTSNPPEPVVIANPPEPEPPEPETVTLDRDPSKPQWADVGSGHPEGATNPPIPELIVTPDGRCYKQWVSGMVFRPGQNGDRVLDCGEDDDCGTPIQCPDKAERVLAEHSAGGSQPK